MKKLFLLAAALTALVAAPASAENWYELAITGDAIGYGDADSIAVHGDTVSARVMLGLRQPMGSKANIEFLVSSVRFRCADSSYLVDEVGGLDSQRKQVTSLPGSREWKKIGKGSLYASFGDFACGKAGERKVTDPFAATAEFWRPDEELIEAATIELAGDFLAG
ncbi:MAG TPA: hypothetical protein VLA37_10715 [Sphingomonadaceae bacterium]|nr:hypothetical protein [Sphingomonadaceae bacterium]